MPEIARRHVNGAAAAVSAALVCALVFSLQALRQQSSAAVWVSHTRDVLEAAEETVSVYKDVPLATRFYLLTRDRAAYGRAEAAERPVGGLLGRLRVLTDGDVEQRARLEALDRAIRDGLQANRRLREERRLGKPITPAELSAASARIAAVRAAADEMIGTERRLLAARAASRQRAARTTRAVLSLLLLSALAGLWLATRLLRRDLRRIAHGEAALAEAHERFRAIVEGSHDFIVALDRDGRVLAANRALKERLLQVYGRALEPGEDYMSIYAAHPAMREKMRAFWTRALRGEEFDAEISSGEGGARRHFELRFSAMRDEHGGTLGAAMTARDVTRRREAEETLRRQKEDLARSNEELERFAYVASHDLKEPLRMVVSYTQLLQRRFHGRLDADADTFIGFAVDGALRMRDLIDGLLEYSRVSRGAQAIEVVDAEKACQRAVDDLRAALADTGARLERAPLPAVMACPGQLHRVFQNLIANALKFRVPGRAPVVSVGARRDGDEWTFSIADNGIGIPREHLDGVFTLFKRLHTQREYPGTGLGLAICKKIIECHGGRIWVESEPGAGSTFRFTAKAADAAPYQASL